MKKLYDLSHVFDENTYHPMGFPAFKNVQMFPSHGCRHALVTMSLHFATHMDAPWHMVEDGKRLDQIDIRELCGEAVVLDVSEKYAPEKATLKGVSVADLEAAAKAAGLDIRAGDAVIVYTGWEKWYETNPSRYYDSYCTLSHEAAQWLAEKKIRLVGLDVPDIDLPASYVKAPFEPRNHRAILGAGIYVIENVGGEIRRLLGKRIDLLPAPMKVGGEYASGAPVRLLAMDL
ncbi:MAG: cyclase family protein [Treponemataceae bacterium]